MKTASHFIVINFVMLIFQVSAQNVKVEKIENRYDINSHEKFIEKYENAADKSLELKRKLAESYFKTGNFTNAEKYYGEVAKSSKSNSKDIYNYVAVLKINRKYDEADKWMRKFYESEPEDSRAKIYFENKEQLRDMLTDNGQFKIKNSNINTPAREFGAAYYRKKQVVFTAEETKSELVKKIFTRNKKNPLTLYVADIKRSRLEHIEPLKKRFNKKYGESTASFNKTGDFTALTLTLYDNKNNTIGKQIFTSVKENGKWQPPVPLPFNSSKYSTTCPALSKDGNTMYFASDMPGGYGGTDIYVTQKNENGEWSKPVNLGKNINTEGNEMFPFIHKDGLLFFASDGLFGIGGLDIFITKKTNTGWLKSKNLGSPVNSSYNDFAIILDDNMKQGFFSSERDGGKGSSDIYYFKLIKELYFDITIEGKIKDSNGNILANSDVTLYNKDNNPVKTVSSDKNGNFKFIARQNETYKIEANKPNYQSEKIKVNTNTESPVYRELILEKLPDFTIKGIIVDSYNKNVLKDVKLTVTENKTNKKLSIAVSDRGRFLLKLPKNRLYDTIDYTFTVKKNTYAPKKVKYKKVLNKLGEYTVEIQMNKIKTGEDLGKIIEINPIYFDFDKYNIRPDAAKELDKIVKIMNEYPTMEIELSSHTDCRGSSIYNLKLSDKRAKASADYIKKRITKPTRISGRGYGETEPVNDCRCEGRQSRGTECSEEQHMQNRRTEFKIIRK